MRIVVQRVKSAKVFVDKNYSPYFYIIVDDAKKRLAEIKEMSFGEKKFKPINAEICEKENAKNVVKLFFKNTMDLKIARDEVFNSQFVKEKREFDIPFAKMYIIDKGMQPLSGLEVLTVNENEIKELKVFDVSEKETDSLKIVSFDLETHSPGRFSNAQKDPIISVSLVDEKESHIFAWKKNPIKI